MQHHLNSGVANPTWRQHKHVVSRRFVRIHDSFRCHATLQRRVRLSCNRWRDDSIQNDAACSRKWVVPAPSPLSRSSSLLRDEARRGRERIHIGRKGKIVREVTAKAHAIGDVDSSWKAKKAEESAGDWFFTETGQKSWVRK